jgi:hypothetical protein
MRKSAIFALHLCHKALIEKTRIYAMGYTGKVSIVKQNTVFFPTMLFLNVAMRSAGYVFWIFPIMADGPY